jgi:hypothetical protein
LATIFFGSNTETNTMLDKYIARHAGKSDLPEPLPPTTPAEKLPMVSASLSASAPCRIAQQGMVSPLGLAD